MQLQIKYVPLDSMDLIRVYTPQLIFLSNFLPYKISTEQLKAFAEQHIGTSAIVYVNDMIIGAFFIKVFKRSAEIHGVCRPDIKSIIPQSGPLKTSIVKGILGYIFDDLGRDVVIMKSQPDNKGVRGLAIQYGFTKLKNTDKGRVVYKLTRDKYKETA